MKYLKIMQENYFFIMIFALKVIGRTNGTKNKMYFECFSNSVTIKVDSQFNNDNS